MAQSWNAATFAPMAGNFVPLLAPANQMNYDTAQFYNAALAIVAGCGIAALSFRLLPPLSRTFRAQRLLQLTLHDLRRLATHAVQRLPDDWESRTYSRLAALPDAAEPLQRGQLVTALSIGREIIELRRIAPQLDFESELELGAQAVGPREHRHRNCAVRAARSASCLCFRIRGADLGYFAGTWPDPSHLRRARSPSRLLRRGSAEMKFFEIDLLGVYVAPISLLMVAAWFATIALRLRAAPLRLAPSLVRVRCVLHRAVVNRPCYCALR